MLTSLDINEVFYTEELSTLFTSIYIYILALTRRKAYTLKKVSMYIVVI